MVTLILEQMLNGLQLGFSLFLISAGLTLVFGIMGVLNLAHGVLYMLGAYLISVYFTALDSYMVAFGATILTMIVLGLVLEYGIIRHLYQRSHLCQVLATFALILFFNDLVTFIWGLTPLPFDVPAFLNDTIEIMPGVFYPEYRLFVIAVGMVISIVLYFVITKTRIGMQVRAGETNREMVGALGVNINVLYVMVFVCGVVLAGLAGIISAPLISIETGIGGDILIISFVVVIIGGLGSVKGAFISSLLVGMWDTMTHAFAPTILMQYMEPATATNLGAGLASMSIYVLMALILITKPNGLYGHD